MASLDLATILGDRYNGEHMESERTISERAHSKISELTYLIRDKRESRGNLAQKERQESRDAKRILGVQTVNEIRLRCDALGNRVGVDPTSMPDSQLLCLCKGLQ